MAQQENRQRIAVVEGTSVCANYLQMVVDNGEFEKALSPEGYLRPDSEIWTAYCKRSLKVLSLLQPGDEIMAEWLQNELFGSFAQFMRWMRNSDSKALSVNERPQNIRVDVVRFWASSEGLEHQDTVPWDYPSDSTRHDVLPPFTDAPEGMVVAPVLASNWEQPVISSVD